MIRSHRQQVIIIVVVVIVVGLTHVSRCSYMRVTAAVQHIGTVRVVSSLSIPFVHAIFEHRECRALSIADRSRHT